MTQHLTISYQRQAKQALHPADLQLMLAAEEATSLAYAPYSHFHVGCALLLEDGQIIRSANQENAAYPQCVCAEVSGINTAAMTCPGKKIIKIFITSKPAMNQVLGPCGQCRQTLLEYERRQQQDIQIGLSCGEEIVLFSAVRDLLPFAF